MKKKGPIYPDCGPVVSVRVLSFNETGRYITNNPDNEGFDFLRNNDPNFKGKRRNSEEILFRSERAETRNQERERALIGGLSEPIFDLETVDPEKLLIEAEERREKAEEFRKELKKILRHFDGDVSVRRVVLASISGVPFNNNRALSAATGLSVDKIRSSKEKLKYYARNKAETSVSKILRRTGFSPLKP